MQWAGRTALSMQAKRAEAAAEVEKARLEAGAGADATTQQVKALLESKGIDTKKPTKKFVRSTGNNVGEVVEAYQGVGGFYTVTTDAEGNTALTPFSTEGYEAWSVEQHSLSNVQKNLNSSIKDFAEAGDFKYNVGDEDNPRFKYRVNPAAFSTAYTNYLQKQYGPNGYVYANTPQGRAHAQSMYKAAYNYSQNTGESIENYPGFFAAVNSKIYGADGKAKVNALALTPDGGPIGLDHYVGLNEGLIGFRDQHPDIKTDGEAIGIALNVFDEPQTQAEKDLVKKAKEMEIPEGSSVVMEFVKLYFNQ